MPKINGKLKEITKRRLAVAQLFNEGVTSQPQIVEKLKERFSIEVTQPTISGDLKALDKQWKEESLEEIDQVKARLIAKYMQIYSEAYAAWRLSLEEAVTHEIADTPKGTYEKTIKKGQSGNPALLAQCQSALKAIRELTGLDAPIKIDWREQLPEGYNPDEVQVQFIEMMAIAANADS